MAFRDDIFDEFVDELRGVPDAVVFVRDDGRNAGEDVVEQVKQGTTERLDNVVKTL